MSRSPRRWLWLLLFVPLVVGLVRLRFDVDVLNLLPGDVPAVQGLKLYQKHFAKARELIITITAPDAAIAETAARSLAEALRRDTALVREVVWQPPWLEHPAQAAELVAFLWLNQPPDVFGELTHRLRPENLAAVLANTRERLATTFSPEELARLPHDPFDLLRLPDSAAAGTSAFGQGQELFASTDGTFRLLFVQAMGELNDYRSCAGWMKSVRELVNDWKGRDKVFSTVEVHFTGSPAFTAEIGAGMERDIAISVGGTTLIIAALFWLAHRRWKPMLWLLTLLALVLAGTLALGGLIFGTVNVVSMGFAAILLGLAVDYALVHYQEALAHPELSVPEIRRAIAPAIFWAAITTLTAFMVLNFGGMPGLAQLGSLVAVGVALSAVVMIFAYLPPLFPDRRTPRTGVVAHGLTEAPPPPSPLRVLVVFGCSTVLILAAAAVLLTGFPRVDVTANALRPANSAAFEALQTLQQHLSGEREPLWLIIGGRSVDEVARRLDVLSPALDRAVSNQAITGFTLPTALWPRPAFQTANRASATLLATQLDAFAVEARSGGFGENAMFMTEKILTTWKNAASGTNIFWPTNNLSRWILDKLVARSPTNFHALGLLFVPTHQAVAGSAAFARLEDELGLDGALLSGWAMLGDALWSTVKHNLWRVLGPMIGLVLISLAIAFRRVAEVLLSLGVLLLSGVCLLAVMVLTGWSWNLLNLMALPLILGTGVDYSIFMQLALRRHHGDLGIAHRSVGRALLLCGGTAAAGFGSLAWSSNAGMASLGKVCAVGIAGNVLISVYLLPVWWTFFRRKPGVQSGGQENSTGNRPPVSTATPSALYRADLWSAGLLLVRVLPAGLCHCLARVGVATYALFARHRRTVVIENLLPVLGSDRDAAKRVGGDLFRQFGVKLVDLWRYEGGHEVDDIFVELTGWGHLLAAREKGRGVLLVTPHLGNWEFGGPLMAQHGIPLHVITLVEPGRGLTEMRRDSRARWGIQTVVIGEDAFAFVEIIKRLQDGAVVALLVDRPPAASAVEVELFGRPFQASIAAAELARASGCALLPVVLPRVKNGYAAHVLPAIAYDRATLGNREARRQLTQQIMRAFEPAIRQNPEQWFHFVPVWLRR